MPPRKKKSPTRTPGFTVTDKEIHDRLDAVRPVAERVYRKFQTRINIKRGDRIVCPTWDKIISDTSISNRRTLAKALKELEDVGLIRVVRTYDATLRRSNANEYYIVPAHELSQWQNGTNASGKKTLEPVANLPKASGKSATVTRMKGTRTNITKMNVTRMKGGGTKSKKNKGGTGSVAGIPDASKKDERGQWQNRTGPTVIPTKVSPVSADEIRKRQEEWNKKQRNP